MQNVTILGSTGSIGVNTLEVLKLHPAQYRVYGLTAHTQVSLLKAQCLEFHPVYAVLRDPKEADKLQQELNAAGCATEVLSGRDALNEVASAAAVDVVMAAIVGGAGLEPSLSAVNAGKRLLLANKEALVMSGQLFMDAAAASGAEVLPIDSEHNAIFQCLPNPYTSLKAAGIRRLLLTGSGGPFLSATEQELQQVTPEQACAHPNWSMGKKISVDSATMMNKGLEFIEACWLFNASPDEIQVVVHPQSIVHSMVEYLDGSVLSQMGNPDMRTPIAHGLAWPQRIESNVPSLDFFNLKPLTFMPPDFGRFPCLKLAIDAVRAGGSYAIALNAVNEIMVDRFLSGQLPFVDIARHIDQILQTWDFGEPDSLSVVEEADTLARRLALQSLGVH